MTIEVPGLSSQFLPHTFPHKRAFKDATGQSYLGKGVDVFVGFREPLFTARAWFAASLSEVVLRMVYIWKCDGDDSSHDSVSSVSIARSSVYGTESC